MKKSIFVTEDKKTKGAHFEFQPFLCQGSSLFVPISKDNVFFEEYLKYLEPTETPDGGTKFDGCGINYYTKEQAQIIYERIQNDKPEEYTILITWLEKIISNPSEVGFYILGV